MKVNKNIFLRFYNYLEDIPTKKPELIVLCLYIVLLAFIAYFHEPWFDEGQAWLIARSASLKEMFFHIPHYEGHPPFWWLILAPFAKAGLPYEIALKTINITLCSIGIGLFLFKAPFKRIIKFLIPFTYFLFYQYGVISRCYCLAIVAFMLAAITYHNRNTKPFAYVGSLMLLCASSAYGIVFSGGLAIVWIWEMLPFTLKDILQKRQFKALALLLVWALFLICIIVPRPDTFATTIVNFGNTFVERFMLLNFVVPLNALLGIASFRFIREFHITLTETIQILLLYLPFSIISIIILRGFKKLLLFAVPFMTFTLFSSLVYLSFWHCGFIVLFFIFIFWQIFQENIVFVWPKFIPKKTRNLMKNAILFLFFCMLFVSVYKCLYQSIWDVIKPYDHSRLITKFIKEYKLENKVIFGQWIFFKPNGEIAHDIPTHLYVSNILPYFKRNIVNNLNFGDDKYPYDIHKVVNQKDYYKEWAKGPKPDIKIGINFTLDMIWPDITKEENDFIFVPLNEKENAVIWVRRDLAQELGLIDKILTMNKK